MKKTSLKNAKATIGPLTITPPSQQINVLRSPLYWPGRKEKLMTQLFELFPKSFESFIDVFCGSGDVAYNVLLHYYENSGEQLPELRLNDKVGEVMLVHQVLNLIPIKDIVIRLNEIYDQFFTPSEDLTVKEQWTIFRDWYNTKPLFIGNRSLLDENSFGPHPREVLDVDRAVCNLLLSAICFSNSPTWSMPTAQTRIPHVKDQLYFNQSFGRLAPFPKLVETLLDFNRVIRGRSSVIDLTAGMSSHDYITKLCEKKVEKGKTLVYVDPPYYGSESGYSRGNFACWSLEEEEELYQDLSLLDERGYLFAFSNDIGINTRLAEWIETDKPEHFNVFTMKKSYAGKITGNRRDIPTKEVLITNYDI